MKISLQKCHDHGKNFWNTCNGHRGTKKENINLKALAETGVKFSSNNFLMIIFSMPICIQEIFL